MHSFDKRTGTDLIIVEGESAHQWTKMWCNGERSVGQTVTRSVFHNNIIKRSDLVRSVMEVVVLPDDVRGNMPSLPFKLPLTPKTSKQKTYYQSQQYIRSNQTKKDGRGNFKHHH